MSFEIKKKLIVSPLENLVWELQKDCVISVNERDYIIPKGFKTDFASTPRLFWWFTPPATGHYVIPAVLHDYMYKTGIVERKYADTIFKYFMIHQGTPEYKANLMYYAVRLFGKSHYTK